jgi:siroheme synthase (precorrin-2 oxidase/ferrochelatase)
MLCCTIELENLENPVVQNDMLDLAEKIEQRHKGNRDVNEKIRIEARKRGLLTNVAVTPDLYDFYLGSVVEKGDLKPGISIHKRSPTMAKRIRELLVDIIRDNLQETLYKPSHLRCTLKADFAKKVEIMNEVSRSFSTNIES